MKDNPVPTSELSTSRFAFGLNNTEVGTVPLMLFVGIAAIVATSAWAGLLPKNMIGGLAVIMTLGFAFGDRWSLCSSTGWGGAFNIARTVRAFERGGVAAVHMEDQVAQKRCGHRPNKAVVSLSEMVDRIKAAVDARQDESFVIMARTDALAVEGLGSALERAAAYVEAGADMIFAEAVTELEQYDRFRQAAGVPILANMTEFGKTELFDKEALAAHGVDMVLYPLSAARAANQAALNVYQTLRRDGHQRAVVDTMQTRESLYDFLGYHHYEQTLDRLFTQDLSTKE